MCPKDKFPIYLIYFHYAHCPKKSILDSDVDEIQRWKKHSIHFIETDIFRDILEILKEYHCVLLTGVPGMGKTFTAQNIALQLVNENRYNLVPCMFLEDIATRYQENILQVFVVDDICGKYAPHPNKIENWRNIKNRVKSFLDKGKTKILATCRTEIFKEDTFQKVFDVFHENVYNLSDKYSFKDKLLIAGEYLELNDQMLSDITDIINKNMFSPLMCSLGSGQKQFDINKFLNRPYDTYCEEWDTLKSDDTVKFCALFLCVIYNGTIDEVILDISNDSEEERKKLEVIFEWCKLNRGTSRATIQAKMNACIDTYFKKEGREYRVIHEEIFDFMCSYFGKTLLSPLLQYADDEVICERVQLGSLHEAHGIFTIMVSADDENTYYDRIKVDLSNGKIHNCLNNMQMKYVKYRNKFLDIIKELDYNLIHNLIKCKDKHGISSFILSCMRGYEDLVDFFISKGASVNAQNGWFTPLTAACRDGHVHTVEILLKKESNINDTNINGETPLYTACFGGHCSLVERLVENNADVNKRNKYNRSPLYASCLVGNVNICSVLLGNGVNVFECKDSLIVACLGGHDKIVEKLISNDFDVNVTDNEGKTALFIACEKGFTKIVSMLLDNNADIYKVDSDGRTPLHASFYSGNNCTVKLLIQKEADVNMLDVGLETPLHKACRKGYVESILTLLEKGADINKINKAKCTPAHLANTEGKIKDERILKALEYREKEPTKWQNITGSKNAKFEKQDNASISNWIRSGSTPLYEACVNGDTETVQSLIRNRASVNMKTKSGKMPLVAACQEGHGFIIQVLLDERANINESLVCAVQNDCDRAVNILLYKGGDLNYTGVDGKSLITLACEHSAFKVLKIILIKGAAFKEIYVNGKKLLNVEFLQLLVDHKITDKYGKSPLFESMEKRFYDLSEFVIQKECPIANSEEKTKTALILVFESGNMKFSKMLVFYGYKENLLTFNKTMLLDTYKLGLLEQVNILLRNGTNIRKKYETGYTPLILADIDGKDKLSEYLQNRVKKLSSIGNIFYYNEKVGVVCNCYRGGEHVKRMDFDSQSMISLFRACMDGVAGTNIYDHIDSVSLQMFYIPRNPYVSIWFEQTPLCLATRRGHKTVIKLLLRFHANVNLTFEDWCTKNEVSSSTTVLYGYTPLFAACQREYYEIVDMLLEGGANLNKALYDACREGYLDTAKFLLQKGADVNSSGRFGQTALYGACIGGYYTIVKFLIDQGAFIHTKVKRASILDEPTCLHAAYQSENHDIVKFLINRGAYVDSVGNFKRTLLHKACSDGNYKTVETLMGKGDINASDLYGATPLIACILQNIEDNHKKKAFIYEMKNEYFLQENVLNQPLGDYCDQLHKKYVNEWNTYYPSDLGSKHKLLTDNHYKVIQLLIENGADINKADKKDRTPLSLAKKIEDMKLTEILLNEVLLPIKKDNSLEQNQDS